jgi:hypothetical protein
LVRRNAFAVKKTLADGWSYGTAVYHVPSFFNYSCMPNTVHYHIGDMIFIISSTTIPKGSENFLTYYRFHQGESVQKRNKELQNRKGGFSCHCALCRFEIENASIVDPANKIVKNMTEKFKQPEWSGSRKAVQELKKARRSLFKQFNLSVPDYDLRQIPMFDTKAPRQFSLARFLLPVLQMLHYSLRKQQAYAEDISCITEIHALINDNLQFTGDKTSHAPSFAMGVWSHHHRRSHPEVAALWLEELKHICSLVGGKNFYERKFDRLVKIEISKHPCQEDRDA